MVRVARVSATYQSLRFMFGEWTTMTLANSNPLTSNVLPTLRWAMRRSAWRIRFCTRSHRPILGFRRRLSSSRPIASPIASLGERSRYRRGRRQIKVVKMDVIGEIVSAWIQREIDRIENSGFRRVAGANQAIHPRRWGPVERTDSPEIAYLNLNDAHGSPLTLCVPPYCVDGPTSRNLQDT